MALSGPRFGPPMAYRNPRKTIALLPAELEAIETVWSQAADPSMHDSPDRRSPRETLNRYIVRLAAERAQQIALQHGWKIPVVPKAR